MSPVEQISSIGYMGIWSILFLESGLFMFFLPGDSLLIAAGIASSLGIFNLSVVISGSILFAFLGNSVGYVIGRKIGAKVFNHPKSWLFNRHRLREAHAFYSKHGSLTIILARFVPIVRTFVPIAAGAAGMNFKKFTLYNLVGASLWTGGITFIGYWLGNVIPNIDTYLPTIILTIIGVSLLPAVFQVLNEKFFLKKS